MTRVPDSPLSEVFAPLREQLLAAAAEFSHKPLAELLGELVDDVERASAEPLEIFPVAHHSPASAVHMVQRLRSRPPKVIFIELCADLQPLVADLTDCTLPVALQAFAATPEGFDPQRVGPDDAPLSVIAPITEFSAEYQAIAFALTHGQAELVFVDRDVDHIFQWRTPGAGGPPAEAADEPDEPEARMHGEALGVELGEVLPSFAEFEEFLLANARVGHFTEWWQLYVEGPTLGADHATYRQLMFLVGSLIRRLGTTPERLADMRLRERMMWTRMKRWLVAHEVAPADALWICGAAHAAADVPEFGTARLGQPDDALWELPPPTPTAWRYGYIPSSYSSIERQFGQPPGTTSLAQTAWEKAVRALGLKPFSLSRQRKKPAAPLKPSGEPASGHGALLEALTRAPALAREDAEQLLGWCVGLVELARKNGYLASTADAIAIFETATLLAGLRGRRQPSARDFSEAAITCLEKTRVPERRSVQRLCELLLGGDRVGHVGYSSAPPLLQDLYDRLAPLGVNPKKTTITRALFDFRKDPGQRALSDLLWQVRYLLPASKAARVIMGERRLGEEPSRESWDIQLSGEGQRDVLQLAFEGVTIEQVLELRLTRRALDPAARTVDALAVVEDAILYLKSEKLTGRIGERAVQLLPLEPGANDAQDIFARARRLVHHFRARPEGLPEWLRAFVATGYQHFSTQLPGAFADRGTEPAALAGMLSFVFTLESLALSMGCQRSQLLIAVRQAQPLTHDPEKLGLLWAAEWLLELRDTAGVRAEFEAILANPMRLPALPATLGGFLLALAFTPLVGQLAVELLTRAFLSLPDALLIPWLPGLISSLKPYSADLVPALLKEAGASLPGTVVGLDAWTPPWDEAPAPPAPGPSRSGAEAAAWALLRAHPEALEAHAAALGAAGSWEAPASTPPPAAAPAPGGGPAEALLAAHPDALHAWAARLGAGVSGGGQVSGPPAARAGPPLGA